MKLIAGLVGLFALGMAGAAAAALAAKQRIVPIDDPEADEVALVAIFGPMAFHSTATAFRGGTSTAGTAVASSTSGTHRSIRLAPDSRSGRSSVAVRSSSPPNGGSSRP